MKRCTWSSSNAQPSAPRTPTLSHLVLGVGVGPSGNPTLGRSGGVTHLNAASVTELPATGNTALPIVPAIALLIAASPATPPADDGSQMADAR